MLVNFSIFRRYYMWFLVWILVTTVGGFYFGLDVAPPGSGMEWVGAIVGFVVGLLLWVMFKAASGESLGDAFGSIGESFGGDGFGDGGGD
jgi:membrane associated rhomboid family serine protease